MKLPSWSIALFALAPLTASAVTINIAADILKDAGGSPLPQTGLVILTTATDGIFNGPSGSNFVTGDEVLLYSWDLSALGMDGTFLDSTGDLSFSGQWDQGDPLRLYWYPTLAVDATGPSVGIPYGYYSDASGIDGSDPWITPDESANITLGFFTSDSSFITGSNSPDAGIASHAVPRSGGSPDTVPDSGSTIVLFGLGMAGLTTRHYLRLKSQHA
jgi:hypothetical protein